MLKVRLETIEAEIPDEIDKLSVEAQAFINDAAARKVSLREIAQVWDMPEFLASEFRDGSIFRRPERPTAAGYGRESAGHLYAALTLIYDESDADELTCVVIGDCWGV